MKLSGLIFISALTSGFCQSLSDQAARITEDLVSIQDENLDYESMYENILQVLSNPVDLNSASAEDLRRLHVLSEQQISEIIRHRQLSGEFVSLYELQSIPSLDMQTVDVLKQLLTVADPAAALNRSILHRIKEEGNNYVIFKTERTLEDKAGFAINADSLTRFVGSAWKSYVRFRSNRSRDYSIGLTIEKDPGEKFTWAPRKSQFGPDFTSFHAQIQNKGRLKNLLVGDFQAQFGQGLIFGGGFGLGKGGETVSTIRRSNVGVLPYSSVNEAGFFRGGSITYNFSKKIAATILYSRMKRDATENTEVTGAISSFQFSGLHRNLKELSSRKLIAEQNAAAVIEYSSNKFSGGVIAHAIDFSQEIVKRPSPYNQFAFTGDRLVTSGAFATYQILNTNIFGEFAKNRLGGAAFIGGTLISLHRKLDGAFVIRKYQKSYNSFYSNALSENTQPHNEQAFYWGLKYQPQKRYTFSGYVDLFEFPWLGFRRYQPSSGYEYLIKASYQPSRKTSLSIQFREERKDRNVTADKIIYEVQQAVKYNSWIKLNYEVSPFLSMKSQFQFNAYRLNGGSSKGTVLI